MILKNFLLISSILLISCKKNISENNSTPVSNIDTGAEKINSIKEKQKVSDTLLSTKNVENKLNTDDIKNKKNNTYNKLKVVIDGKAYFKKNVNDFSKLPESNYTFSQQYLNTAKLSYYDTKRKKLYDISTGEYYEMAFCGSEYSKRNTSKLENKKPIKEVIIKRDTTGYNK